MNKRVEVGMGSVVGERRDSFALGKSAAQQALARITHHAPSLILVFASEKYALPEMLQGIRTVSRQTPLIGTSTAGETASVLVFGNELSEVARSNQENERLYAQLQGTIRDLEQAGP